MATHQTAKTQYVSTPRGTKFAYRRLGTSGGTPLVVLTHFRGVMDKLDPELVNALAAQRAVVLVDYAGVGLSTGAVATTVRQAADDVAEFLGLVGAREVDVLGFSLGGYVAQLLALNTGSDAAGVRWWARVHERSRATSGEEPAAWLSEGYVDGAAGLKAQVAQIAGYAAPETSQGLDGSYERLPELGIPVLVVNGHDDYMIPTANSFVLQQRLPNAQLVVYPDSGHGALFQYASLFAKHAVLFLEA
ncbi:Alpha/Beta hydrolase protein [Lasiosphaeria miniovina]|uniref:Alpha/Beta hydrolase protein n=1 Tax=Lasiosphaeria miniovina TaxID=1954250 RepID=A0AA40AKU7_9PEZI|nr:Alpha/Beta hydrolase protein [Lasiosphaeria miniovina]KAK0717698.1 Alpha/Beta hydrolase protein [Lasiosphaeria miniovina]